jgi:hypothetical protein
MFCWVANVAVQLSQDISLTKCKETITAADFVCMHGRYGDGRATAFGTAVSGEKDL